VGGPDPPEIKVGGPRLMRPPGFTTYGLGTSEPELSNDNDQPSATSYALLRHDCFNVMTNIDLITVHSFPHKSIGILMFRTPGPGARRTALRAH